MSTDRTTEILNYLSAISRDMGELRATVKEIDARLIRVESSVNSILVRLDRLEARMLDNRADVRELAERVSALESR